MAQPKIKDNAIDDTITSGNVSGFIIGTAANNILQLNGTSQIPAVDGSLILNINDSTKLPLIGGTLTGNLKINPATTPAIFIATAGTGSSGSTFQLEDETGQRRFNIEFSQSGVNEMREFDAAGVVTGTYQFIAGQIRPSATQPLNAADLTRKDYVDNKVVILDTPIQLYNGVSPPTTATAVTHATLSAASKAIVRAKCSCVINGPATTGTQVEVIGYIGSSATAAGNSLSRTGDAYLIKEGTHSTNMYNYDWNDVTVNLDGSKQLWYNTLQVVQANTTVWFELILIGYYTE